MCLELLITRPRDAQAGLSAERLSRLSHLQVTAFRTASGEKAYHLAVEPGCSCDFLGDNASLDPDIWHLKPEHLPALASALRAAASAGGAFTFRARFLGGEREASAVSVSAARLLELVQMNQIANNVTYLVA
jgi:hypothetical protein